MSRTGASNSRKPKTTTKSTARKPAAKQTRSSRKSATVSTRSSRTKPTPKIVRHGIGTPAKAKTLARTPVAKASPRRSSKDALPKAQHPKAMKSNDTKKMKHTTPDKPKAPIKEKEKRVKASEPVKAKELPKAKPASPIAVAPVVKEPKVKAPKAAAKAITPKLELPPPDFDEELAPPRRKTREPREPGESSGRAKGTRSRAAKIPGFDDELMQDYVMDEEAEEEESPDEMALDPLELPLELLDPELVEIPHPSSPPKPKQKIATANRRQQACSHCGNMFTWLSVEQLCFNCLKKKLAQRKREDESYSGFTPEAEEEEDFS